MAKIQTKSIKGFSDYHVSTSGVVYSNKRGDATPLKGCVWQGYQKVTLRSGTKSKTMAVHRLVAETFLDKPRGSNVVNHIDGKKSNNNLSNLEWTTHRGNSKHYGEKLAPVYKAKRDKAKSNSLTNKLNVVKFAFNVLKDDPESFAKVYAATLGDN
jgi:hypothetical protein